MRFLCASCERLAPIASFRTDAQTLVLVCARCGAENRTAIELAGRSAAAPGFGPALSPVDPPSNIRPSHSADSKVIPLRPVQAQDADDPFKVPPGRCPKCIAAMAERAESCSHCGLVFANAQGDDYRPSAPLSEFWVELLSKWDDSSMHDKLLARAGAQGELASVGRLYRLRLATAPSDPLALRGRDEVLRLAAVPSILNARTTESEAPAPRWGLWAVLGIALILFVVLMVIVFPRLAAPRM